MNLSKIRILLPNKRLLFMGMVFFLLTIILVVAFSNRDIVINVDDNEVEYSFKGKQTVGEVLEAQKISLREEDKVEPSLNTVLKDGDQITVKRALPVTVTVDNKEYNFFTVELEVQKILEQLNIEIGELDIVEPGIDSEVNKEEQHIDIVRVEEKYESDTAVLQYKNIVKKNNNMDQGITNLVQKGDNGLKTVKEKVVYHDGEEVQREVVEETVTKKPVDEIKEVGTNTLIATSRGSHHFTKTITVEVTAYYVGDVTASGTKPTANRTIAASSNFAFGTKMYIPGFKDGSNGGIFVVEDRGGVIKGNKIDVYMNSRSEAVNFGRRTMKAYVLQ